MYNTLNNQNHSEMNSYDQFMKEYNQLSYNLSQNGISPEAYVNQLINSGQMSQEQFIRLSRIADQLLGRK